MHIIESPRYRKAFIEYLRSGTPIGYAEAKGNGYDTKTMRKVLRLRRMDTETRNHEIEMVELYGRAIDIFS